jgi:hypothetical protein
MKPTASARGVCVLAQQADQVQAQLRARLAPEDYHLVLHLRHLEGQAAVMASTAAEQRVLATLVACLPDSMLALLGEAVVRG